MKLIADSQKQFIPLQYRFLSLYKFLELTFKSEGKWTKGFYDFLNTIRDEYVARKLSDKKLDNYIHIIRDKCAHIKLNKHILGVTSLSYKEEKQVKDFLEFISFACIEYVNQVKLSSSKARLRHREMHGFELY